MKKIMLSVLCLFLPLLTVSAAEMEWDFNDWQNCSYSDFVSFTTPGQISIFKAYDDEFGAGPLDAAWTAENLTPATQLEFNEGLLLFKKDGGSWENTTDTAPKIMQPVNFRDDFEIETAVTGRRMIGGFFIRQDSNNAIAVRFNYHYVPNGIGSGDKIYVYAWQNDKGVGQNKRQAETLHPVDMNESELQLKIKKTGTQISTYYKSITETAWHDLYTFGSINYVNAYAGIFCTQYNQFNYWTKADYYYYSGNDSDNATYISSAHDFGAVPVGTGYLSWEQDLPGPGSSVRLYVQTSDNGASWPEQWTGPYEDFTQSKITSTNRRYIRFMAKLQTADMNYPPVLKKANIKYRAFEPETNIMNDFKAYPTIARGVLNLSYRLDSEVKDASIVIKDSTGRFMRSVAPKKNRGSIILQDDVSSFPNGVYFVKIKVVRDDGREEWAIRKFVIKK